MSRVLTTYEKPSISDRIRQSPDIESLDRLRAALAEHYEAGKLEAQERTIRDWNQAIFHRVCQLVDAAQTAADATFIYNVCFRWYPQDEIRRALDAFVQRRCAAL